jgi:hypothetical protein
LVPAASSAADLPDEQWSIMTNLFDKAADRTGIALLGISIEDSSNISEQVSTLVGSIDGNYTSTTARMCSSMEDSFCTGGKAQYFSALLPPCTTSAQMNCIASLIAIKDGKEIVGTYERNFPDKGYTDFPASQANGLPQGSTPSIWNLEGLSHGGGTNQYLINFVLRGGFERGEKATFQSYEAAISPVTIKSGAYGRNQFLDGRDKNQEECKVKGNCGTELRGNSYDDKFVCASLADGSCALRQAFPTNVRFKLITRLAQSPTGWFHGRMKSPTVDIQPISGGINISVEAEPVNVPVVGILEDYSKLPESMQVKYSNPQAFGWSTGGAAVRSNKLMMPSPASAEAFDIVATWRDYIKDKANANPSAWTVRTLNSDNSSTSCFKSTTELVGIVTTNSMVYLGSPPEFNKESQSLDYRVASPHLTSKGEVFQGTYDLQLKSDVARCLYGFSNAPISASISIVNTSGDAKIATTVLSEKNGWLRLAAYGFTFSEPTVRVKLTQQAAPAKKTSITCTKGKFKKKVTAVSPKCQPDIRRLSNYEETDIHISRRISCSWFCCIRQRCH